MNLGNSRRIALCGVLGALMFVLMMLGSIIPFAAILCPGLAGILLIPAAREAGNSFGVALYGAISLLSLILLPDKEVALLFVFLLGIYPLFRPFLQHIRRPMRVLVKLLFFNVTICAVYALLLFVFTSASLTQEFSSYGTWFMGLFLLAGNIVFLIYDLCLERLTFWYIVRLRPKLFSRGGNPPPFSH